MRAKILVDAEDDLEGAFDHYEAQKRGLGVELLDEFRRGLARILEHPNAWQALDERYRRYRLHRFPYGIVYRLTDDGVQILIVAVMHLSRAPDSWRYRDR